MPTIHDQACEILANLEERTRVNGDEFICLKDDAPEWMRDAIREAHGGLMPDDWRYRLIRRALFAIVEADEADEEAEREDGFDFDDALTEQLDSAVDVYTGELTDWLASNIGRVGYCDEEDARDSIAGWIQAGQLCELREIAESLLATFRARADLY